MRRATVSLRGLNRSCGSVSHAGNSNTWSWRLRRSSARSCAPRLELVTTKTGRFSACRAIRNGLTEEGAIIRWCSFNEPTSVESPENCASNPCTAQPLSTRLCPTSKMKGGLNNPIIAWMCTFRIMRCDVSKHRLWVGEYAGEFK